MKIILGVISVVLLASVVRADLLGSLTAIFKCGQQNAGNASAVTAAVATSKLSQMGAKCKGNQLPGLVGLLQCTGTDVLQLVGELTTTIPNAVLDIVSQIPIFGGFLGNILGVTLDKLLSTLGPLLTPVFELLATLLDIPGVVLCVNKSAPNACADIGKLPGLGSKVCP